MANKKNKQYPESTVGAFIINKQGKLLLIKSKKWRDKYVIPGGHIELGEKMYKAVAREAREEAGVIINEPRLFFIQEAIFAKEFFQKKHFVFLEIFCKTKSNKVKIDNDEAEDFIWIEPKKALKMNVERFTKNTIRKYLMLKKDGLL